MPYRHRADSYFMYSNSTTMSVTLENGAAAKQGTPRLSQHTLFLFLLAIAIAIFSPLLR
jgi:hypothetical protein